MRSPSERNSPSSTHCSRVFGLPRAIMAETQPDAGERLRQMIGQYNFAGQYQQAPSP